MPRFFSDSSTNAIRAQQLWQILIAAAVERRILTYGMVADLIGIGVAVSLNEPLHHIEYWCIEHDLPPLTAVVVSSKTGRPGGGFSLENMDKAREDVFSYAWYRIVPPTVAELTETFKVWREKL